MYLLTSLKVKVLFYIAQLRQQNKRQARKLSIMNKQSAKGGEMDKYPG